MASNQRLTYLLTDRTEKRVAVQIYVHGSIHTEALVNKWTSSWCVIYWVTGPTTQQYTVLTHTRTFVTVVSEMWYSFYCHWAKVILLFSCCDNFPNQLLWILPLYYTTNLTEQMYDHIWLHFLRLQVYVLECVIGLPYLWF